MRTFDTAHSAAKAYAGAHKARVQKWLVYTDRLIRRREIRPITNGRGHVKGWYIMQATDWWLIRTEGAKKPVIEGGPFNTKREALEAAGTKTAKKYRPGAYIVRRGPGWHLWAMTTERAQARGYTV